MQEFEIVDQVIQSLEEIDGQREEVIRLTRKLNRASGRGIAILVKNGDYSEYLDEGRSIIKEIEKRMIAIAPITSWNMTISGTEEYGEFEILVSIINRKKIPSPSSIHIPGYIWISALGDVIGELRRIMLNHILNNELDLAKEALDNISEIYEVIAGLDFSKALVPNLRRKTDVARTLIERCESDFTNALLNKRT